MLQILEFYIYRAMGECCGKKNREKVKMIWEC